MKFKVNPFLIIYLFIIAMAVLALSTGCSPVQRALGPKYYAEVKDSVIMRDGCKTDSFIKFLPGKIDSIPYPVPISRKELDTAALAAAIKRVVTSNDQECLTSMQMSYTAGYNDAIEKIGKEKFADKKPDTVLIEKWDTEKEKLLTSIVNKLNTKLIQTQQAHAEEVKRLKAQIKEESDGKRKWKRRFLFVVIALVLYLARKPLLQGGKKLLVLASRLVSPIKF